MKPFYLITKQFLVWKNNSVNKFIHLNTNISLLRCETFDNIEIEIEVEIEEREVANCSYTNFPTFLTKAKQMLQRETENCY